ncbi:MAG: hypothetical protein JXJ20_08915 [Anaerolineae bacterium]|nr:hypothetical protein [Anaerolineae bacterium]
MKHRWLLILLLVTLLITSPGAAYSDDGESPLLRLLRFIPNNPDARAYVTFGDMDAWHTSWNVPRPPILAAVDLLGRVPRSYWQFIMPRQTALAKVLGMDSLHLDEQRSFYGFDVLQMDRFIAAGWPPDEITVVEHSFDTAAAGEALIASGYEAEALDQGGTLYSILGDFEVNLDLDLPHVGRVGERNRIALLDGQMIIGRATTVIDLALSAQSGDSLSLADDPIYLSAVHALDNPAFDGMGELIGVIFMEGPIPPDPTLILDAATAEEAAAMLEAQTEEQPLPFYSLVAFATRHTEGASYLILAVVFAPGTDASAAAETLAARMQPYVTFAERPLCEEAAFEFAAGIEDDPMPVGVVVLRADDPPTTADNEALVNTRVFAWGELVVRRDLGFLAYSGASEAD